MKREREELLFCRRSVWADFPSSMFLCRLCMHWLLWWGWSFHWEERISGASAKSWGFTEWFAMISERGVVYRTKKMGPSTEPWGTPYMSCDGDEDELLTEVNWYLSERYEWNHWSAVDWMPKTEFRRERRIWWSRVSKAAERSNKRRTKMLSLSGAERISFTIRNKTVSVLCPVRQADWKGLLRLFSWRWERSLWRTAFSRILDRSGRLEMGR